LNWFISILIGVAQGIAEWLPISSKTVVMLILLLGDFKPCEAYSLALGLHAGSMLAVILYFKDRFKEMIKAPFKGLGSKIIISSLATGLLGVPLYFLVSPLLEEFKTTLLLIASGLVATSFFLVLRQLKGYRESSDMSLTDSLLVGVAQAFSILPGVSRSGVTVAAMLLLGFNLEFSIEYSFLLSPIAMFGGLILSLNTLTITLPSALSFLSSFLTSILSIWFLMKIAKEKPGSLALFFILVLALFVILVFKASSTIA